jgi:putative flippase GtrA
VSVDTAPRPGGHRSLRATLATGRLPLAELRGSLGRHALPAGIPSGMPAELLRFAMVGVCSTLAYLMLYSLLRSGLGPFVANLVALVLTAVANTAANRRLTFGVRGSRRAILHHLQGLVVFALGLGLTTGALAALAAWASAASRPVELVVLVSANALATVLRFVAFRSWIFRRRSAPTSGDLRVTELAEPASE